MLGTGAWYGAFQLAGSVGGAFVGIGFGIADLVSNPEEKCEECQETMTINFCKRQCIECVDLVNLDNNLVDFGNHCG